MPFQKGNISWNKGTKGICKPNMGSFQKGENHPNYGKHHPEETLKKQSEAKRGKKNPFYGRHHTEETLRKMSKAKRGKNHPMYGKHLSEEHRRNMSEAHKGKRRSEETCRKHSESISGENHYNWKGGYEKYYGPDWEQQKRLVRKRDKGICQDCGVKEDGHKHDTHHIIPFRVYGLERYEEANRLENLMTLCPKCHTRIESFRRS